jgi:hypothetical protein
VQLKSITGEIMKTSLLKILATSMAVYALQSSAAVVIIDTFATSDAGCVMVASAQGTSCGSSVSAPEAAGGTRTLTLTRTDSFEDQPMSVGVLSRFHFSNAINAQSTATLDYNTSAVTANGLDLTSSGTQAGLHLIYHVDLLGLNLEIAITSNGLTNSYLLPTSLTPLAPTLANPDGLIDLYIPFSSFNMGAGCTTCSTADRLFFTLAGSRDAIDMSLTYISTYDAPPNNTPIPGTILLVLFGALGLLRKKL